MKKQDVVRLIKNNNITLLAKEAKRRGYVKGATVDYGQLGAEMLGGGDYSIIDSEVLVKYDEEEEDSTGWYDVLFDIELGWTKLSKSTNRKP